MRRDWTGLLILGSIALVFFYLYSVSHFKGFNSDNAIHVLMASDFVFPHDLYYWGQDRLGSFLPMIASLFVLTNIPPLLAVSITQILLLGGGTLFLGKSLINKNNLPALGLLIFLPPSAFNVAVQAGHPYISHLFFLSFFLFISMEKKLTPGKKAFILPVIAFLMLWCSEIAMANFLAALIFLPSVWKRYFSLKRSLYVVLGSVCGMIWVLMAKYFAARDDDNYMTLFASFENMGEALSQIAHNLYQVVIWKSGFLPDSITFYVIVITIVFIIYKKVSVPTLSVYFLWSSLFTFLLILFSNWSYIMGLPLRYYTPAYFQLLLALFFILDHNKLFPKVKALPVYILVIGSALNGYLHLRKYSYEVDERLTREEAKTLAQKGSFGIIASYWNSYAIEAFAPERLISTPHDTAYVRNPRALRNIWDKDSILIIENEFTELKDTIGQFGAVLVRQSGVKQFHEFEYAFYRVDKTLKSYYSFKDMTLRGGEIRENGVYFNEANIPSHFAFYGPQCTLPPGTYRVCFDMDYDSYDNDPNYIDIIGKRHHKNILLAEMRFKPGMKEYCLEFTIEETMSLVKFRMHYLGGEPFSFYGVEVEEI